MDRLSFVFSLLLIVSVTTITFGSVIKAKNPNGKSLEKPRSHPDRLFPNMALKELGALLKRSHHQSSPDMKTNVQAKLQRQKGLKDQESKMSKRVDPEILIPGTITLENRDAQFHKVTIDIENYSGYLWERVSTFFIEGTEYDTLPVGEVPDGTSVELELYNPEGEVGGVLVYYIEDIDASVAMAFYVADSGNLWSVATYSDDSPANEVLYLLQILFDSHAADDQEQEGTNDFGLTHRVFMSTLPEAVLKIKIESSE